MVLRSALRDERRSYGPAYEAADESRIANVAAHKVQLPSVFRQIVEPAMAVEGVVQGQGGDVCSRRDQASVRCDPMNPSAPVTRILST